MKDALQGFENICDKEILQTNLSYMALYIGLYEHMADMIRTRIESFLCHEMCIDEDGKCKYTHNDLYKKVIMQRVVDEYGNKDVLKASMLWFVDSGAITQEEYELFLSLKDLRNSFTHEMSQHMWDGLSEEHAPKLAQLLDLYCKIDKWWINEIEIPIAGDEVPDSYDREGVESVAFITFKMMINTLYADKSDEYLKIIHDLQRKYGEE